MNSEEPAIAQAQPDGTPSQTDSPGLPQIEPGMPTTAARLGFWLILGICSTVFAEVTCGNLAFPLFEASSLVIALPVYMLHSLVLAGIVWRWGRPRWEVLYFAGMLFGLYEAYLTKQLWNPTWDAVWKLGGVTVLDTIVLVAFWHAIFAFFLPLLATEAWLCRGNTVLAGMPGWLRRSFTPARAPRGLLVAAILWGVIHLGTELTWDISLLALFGNGAVIAAACLLWRWATRNQRYTLDQLLPTRREVFILLIPLSFFSLVLTFNLRPEALPGLGPQLIILVIYGIVGWLLWLALRKSRNADLSEAETPGWSWRAWILLALVALSIPLSGKVLLGEFTLPILLLCWFGYILAGLVLVIAAIRTVLRRSNTAKVEGTGLD